MDSMGIEIGRTPIVNWWFGGLEIPKGSPYGRDCYLKVPLENVNYIDSTCSWC